MPDDPSLGEIARAVARIEQGLSKLVSTDVYTAHRLADQERMARLESDQKADRAERERSEEKAATLRRWVVAVVIIPIAGILLQLYMASKGAP